MLMNSIPDLNQHLDQQMTSNAGKNLFAQNNDHLAFLPLSSDLKKKLQSLSDKQEDLLLNNICKRSLEAFYSINQYYYFSEDDKVALRNIYLSLLQHIKTTEKLRGYEKSHFGNLRRWLLLTNPFALKLYGSQYSQIPAVVCEEYELQLQMDILNIIPDKIKEPLLDIGCGQNGNLVKHLRHNGIHAFGFDRLINNADGLYNADWLNIDYGIEQWGTIVSNLGFSNHFNHHHQRVDGRIAEYASTYMQILHSLKPEGTFHYAPSLPFIEPLLDKKRFSITSINITGTSYQTTIITRKK